MINNLSDPKGLAIDQEGVTIYIADSERGVISWTIGEQNSREFIKNLGRPVNILIGKESNSIIIADNRKKQVIRSSLQIGNIQSEIIINNIGCYGLAMDDDGSLYVSVVESEDTIHQVRRFAKGNTTGVVVAGGKRYGSSLQQFVNPKYVTINSEGAIYVSDESNHRVVKWDRGAMEGTVVAGFGGSGSHNTQLKGPAGIVIDANDNLYIADSGNDRIVRYRKNEKTADILIDSSAIRNPQALIFDRQYNLYVAVVGRLYRFSLIA